MTERTNLTPYLLNLNNPLPEGVIVATVGTARENGWKIRFTMSDALWRDAKHWAENDRLVYVKVPDPSPMQAKPAETHRQVRDRAELDAALQAKVVQGRFAWSVTDQAKDDYLCGDGDLSCYWVPIDWQAPPTHRKVKNWGEACQASEQDVLRFVARNGEVRDQRDGDRVSILMWFDGYPEQYEVPIDWTPPPRTETISLLDVQGRVLAEHPKRGPVREWQVMGDGSIFMLCNGVQGGSLPAGTREVTVLVKNEDGTHG